MNALERALAAAALCVAAAPCAAQWQPAPLSQVWVSPGFYSYHFDRDAGLEDFNPGLGVEWPVHSMVSLTAGRFRNSNDAMSNYLGAFVMPWRWGAWRLGAVVAGFDGYPNFRDGGWFPALIPAVAYEARRWGLNVGFVPKIEDRLYGALSFQFKFRWEAPVTPESAGSSDAPR